jgi:hypothetical protein
MTTTTTTTAADIQVRLHQTLPNGYKIFECRRFLTNCYDKDKKVRIQSTTTGATMRVATSHLPRAGPLVTALGTRYFTSESCTSSASILDVHDQSTMTKTTTTTNEKNKKISTEEEDIIEIVQVSMLPANDPVAINHCHGPTPATLEIGDILVCPPSAPSLLSSPSSSQQLLWKTATLKTVTRARDWAIRAGESSYLMYFAQSPPTTTAGTTTAVVTATTTTTTTTTPSTIIAAAAKNATVPTLITADAHAAVALAAAATATATSTNTTTLAAPDRVPSCEMVVEEQVSSTAITGMTTTVKRKTSLLLNSNGAKKRHKVNDNDGGGSGGDRSSLDEVQEELPANVYDKIPCKQRHDTLWCEASTKYESAQAKVETLKSGAARLAEQYQALHHAVTAFVLPSLPAKVGPPQEMTTTGDFAVMFQRVAEYTTALIERNKEFEEYIAALDIWQVRVSTAIDKWYEQEEPQRECRDARIKAHERLETLQKDIVVATAALRQAEAREADAIQADQITLEELLQCFL